MTRPRAPLGARYPPDTTKAGRQTGFDAKRGKHRAQVHSPETPWGLAAAIVATRRARVNGEPLYERKPFMRKRHPAVPHRLGRRTNFIPSLEGRPAKWAEVIDLYLTRRAAQHGTTLAELGTHLGLRDGRGRWPGRFGIELAPCDVHRLAPILGLVPAEVENMQLSSYDQLVFDLTGLAQDSPIAGTRMAAHAAWVWLAGSMFCPVCLAKDDGAWRLSWRIPWMTACVRHGVALTGSCAACGGVPGLGNRLCRLP